MPQEHDPRPAFRDPSYIDINVARLDHLASILEQMGSQAPAGSVLELGAGVGDHSSFWLDRGFRLTTSGGRLECVAALRERFPNGDVKLIDMDAPVLGSDRYDVIYAYELLHHLKNPALALQSMSKMCRDLLFLETCVSFGDDLAIHPEPEPADSASQSIHGLGCRPSRPWVFEELRKSFKYVYQVGWQPRHDQFTTDWKSPGTARAALHRTIFVASRRPLDVAGLVPYVLDRQTLGAPRTQARRGDILGLIEQHDIDTVLDVGANLGQFAQGLRDGGYQGRIISFEPQQTAFESLRRAQANDPLWDGCRLALGKSAGELSLNLSANSYSSSFLQPESATLLSEPAVGYVGAEMVLVERLDVLWPNLNCHRTLLKIDVQGFEQEVLEGAGSCLERIDLLFIETSLVSVYKNEPLIETMIAFLRRKDFVPVWIGPAFVDRMTGQVYQCDVAFARIGAINRRADQIREDSRKAS